MNAEKGGHERPWTTEEAADFLQIHPRTVTRLAVEGVLPAFRIGTHWRFIPSAIDAWMRAQVCSHSSSTLSAATRKEIS